MVAILMMSEKPGLLKTEVFWNKRYDVTIFVRNIANKILPGDPNYVVDVVM